MSIIQYEDRRISTKCDAIDRPSGYFGLGHAGHYSIVNNQLQREEAPLLRAASKFPEVQWLFGSVVRISL